MPAQSGKKQEGQDAHADFSSGIVGGDGDGASGVHIVLDQVKSGSPMALALALDRCNGQNVSPALGWSGEPKALST